MSRAATAAVTPARGLPSADRPEASGGRPPAGARAFRVPFAAMASACEVMLEAADEAEARRLAQVAIDEVLRIEAKFSRYRDDSIVSRINAAAGRVPVPCDAETCSLLDHAEQLHRASDGRFDITSGVLRRVWNFREPRVPTRQQIDAVLAQVGWPRVRREGASIFLPEAGMEIDFGGFGKEYAADRAGAALAAQGVRHGYVNLAGDLRVLGPRPDGTPWSIGIRHPRQPGAVVATLPIVRGGLATSGDYERFFEVDGQRYCHVLDTRTGLPVTGWRSVSVLAPLAVMAGNAATLAMLAQDEAIDFLERTGLDYLAIDHHGALHLKGGRAQTHPED